jgi:hypothetical protein
MPSRASTSAWRRPGVCVRPWHALRMRSLTAKGWITRRKAVMNTKPFGRAWPGGEWQRWIGQAWGSRRSQRPSHSAGIDPTNIPVGHQPLFLACPLPRRRSGRLNDRTGRIARPGADVRPWLRLDQAGHANGKTIQRDGNLRPRPFLAHRDHRLLATVTRPPDGRRRAEDRPPSPGSPRLPLQWR